MLALVHITDSVRLRGIKCLLAGVRDFLEHVDSGSGPRSPGKVLSQVSTSVPSHINRAYRVASMDFTSLLALHVSEPEDGICYNADQSPALNGATAIAADHARPVLVKLQ
jgi:hypothetical protein